MLFQSISSGKPKYNFLNLSPPNPGWSEKTRQSMLRERQIFETDDDDNDDILWKYNIIEFNILGKWLPFSLWKLLKLLRLPWPRFFQHFISDDQVHRTSSTLIILPVLEKLQELGEYWEKYLGFWSEVQLVIVNLITWHQCNALCHHQVELERVKRVETELSEEQVCS